MTKENEVPGKLVKSVTSFEQEFGKGSYEAEAMTKEEYERRQEHARVFLHRDGERVW